jgi:hypothetical protein
MLMGASGVKKIQKETKKYVSHQKVNFCNYSRPSQSKEVSEKSGGDNNSRQKKTKESQKVSEKNGDVNSSRQNKSKEVSEKSGEDHSRRRRAKSKEVSEKSGEDYSRRSGGSVVVGCCRLHYCIR